MNYKCLFLGHRWGPRKNIREDKSDIGWMILPLAFLYVFFGRPKVCDRTCYRCGKVKTEPYERD